MKKEIIICDCCQRANETKTLFIKSDGEIKPYDICLDCCIMLLETMQDWNEIEDIMSARGKTYNLF